MWCTARLREVFLVHTFEDVIHTVLLVHRSVSESIGCVNPSSVTCAFHMFTPIVTCPRRVAHTFHFSCMRRQQTLGTYLFIKAISLLHVSPVSKVLRDAPWKKSATTAVQPYRVVG